MMKKIYIKKLQFLYVFVLLGIMSYGQEIKIPNLVLPSPEAFEMTKFGNLPIDESTGRVSPTIPIHTYEVGKLQVPISLAYSGNGVKVEQKPTWTGINWNLNTGGVITRTVKDVPDENGKPRIFYSLAELTAMEVNGVPPLNLMNQLALQNDTADSEGDVFNFTFPGYSGEFVLVKNSSGVFEAKLLKYEDELKIEILGSFTLTGDYQFKITTTDGTSYSFGGIESGRYAVEETQFSSIGEFGVRNYGVRAKTAFYLTTIENYLGDRIFLEYYTKDEYRSFFSGSKALYDLVETNPAPPICGIPPPPNDGPNDINILSITTFHGKFLKRMWNQQTAQTVDFESVEYTGKDSNGGGSFAFKGRILTGINFTKGRVNLEYSPTKSYYSAHPNTDIDKFYLDNVTFKNPNNTASNEIYKLEYNDAGSVPRVTSKAQDYLGYYNGQNGNPTLLPKNSATLLSYEIGVVPDPNALPNPRNFTFWNYMLGDRTPSFEYASKGVLTKMIYPTGGSSVFEYEPIIKKPEYTSRLLTIYNNNSARIPVSKLTDYTGINYDLFAGANGETNLPDAHIVYIDQTVYINLAVTIHERDRVSSRDYIYIKVIDQDTHQEKTEKWFFPNVAPYDDRQNFTASIPFNLIKNHRYSFQIEFDSNPGGAFPSQNPSNPVPPFVEVIATFEFNSGLNQTDGVGIRIKKVVDFENGNSAPINIKRYYYQTLKSKILNQPEMGMQMYLPNFYGNTRILKFCPGTGGGVVSPPIPMWTFYLSLNSNSFEANSFSNGALAMYSDVTISYGGDNFENGALEKSFLIRNDRQAETLTSASANTSLYHEVNEVLAKDTNTRTNVSEFNGTLLNESVWESKNNILLKKKASSFTYAFEETTLLNNISGKSNGGYEGIIGYIAPGQMGTVSDVYIGTYQTKSHKIKKITNTTKEFIDGVPITAYTSPLVPLSDEDIEAPTKKITTTQETNYYDEVAGLPSSIKTSKSDNTVSEVKNYYPLPNCINLVTSTLPTLSQNDISALNVLKAQNRIDNPFQVETYKDSDKLSTKRIIYKLNEMPSSAFEYKIQTAKGNNPLEDRIVYHKYDSKGNPVELSLQDGTHVVYIWSYQRKPIYKIVNATYAQVVSAMSSGGTLDPAQYDPNNPQPEILTNPFIISLPNAQVTLFNYDSVTQLLKSVIDEKGNVVSYEYDDFNRLWRVKDKNGNTISENKYNYRP